MARQELVGLLKAAEGFIGNTIGDLSDEQLSTVPAGMSNDIVWNLGHLAHSLASMTYSRSGLDYPLPADYKDLFKGGSSPSTWDKAPNAADVVKNFNKINASVTDDLMAGKFDKFEAFDLMPGVTMNSIEQILGFHMMHAGMHMHAIGAIKRAVV